MTLAASRTAACPHAEGSSDLWSPVSDVAMVSKAVCAACALRIIMSAHSLVLCRWDAFQWCMALPLSALVALRQASILLCV